MIKQANTSLNEFTNSGYSSDPKTYLKVSVSLCGIKSNSSMAASFVPITPGRASRSGSPGTLLSVLACTDAALAASPAIPDDQITPSSSPRTVEFPFVNAHMALPWFPVNVMFETVTPDPINIF